MKVSIDGVYKSFGHTEVLKDVSLSVNEGEFVTLLGPSGSGKSTLFHLIGGLMTPDKGSIFLNGEQVNGKRGLISYMPQQPSLLPWRTVLDNVLLGQELSQKPEIEKGKDWLRKVGLGDYENSYPSELSGGMKQRVAFIRALLSPQNLMCLDEPFSALDELTRLEMQRWLLSIWEEHRRSILFVTHSIEEALLLSDRIYILSQRPAAVIEEINVPFSRPRKEALPFTDQFVAYKRHIYDVLKHEV
ncbi:ABC transporter ATP-binding protein [Peribacillus cavernae]|uniref:ABC transporter ATP-binding protein n=1 Tax=Peribacillus cavernae TaxID=1674310 RepID=A0A433HRM5_9BACI|nr:ABC transporter ATP-binding protein [Peribacillus cavernae]MDQ0218769.1 ABC-type nitrate/sulfonate/bicarbonate transport system ATPase subunit [Peribacillus cavernae]RUQ30980.1 ABC transporter ATP-binding protein [Peribacillus cavernae]